MLHRVIRDIRSKSVRRDVSGSTRDNLWPMSPLATPTPYEDLIRREWSRIASAGTWLTGAQRVAVAAQARAAKAELAVTTPELASTAIEAARTISTAAHEIRGPWVKSLYERGLGELEYIEILGVVARLTSIDTFLFGLGQPERPLPQPLQGEPSRQVVDEATINGGWAPTVGVAFAPNALSAVKAEAAAMMDLHDVMYLSIEQMGMIDIVRDLQRDQLETVAARTSLINDCFF